MNNIFFASDLHLGHNQPFIYEARGFQDIYEHDATIIHNWNNKVGPDDEIFLLGDVFLNNNEYGLECLKQLNGKIHIIAGNHCTDVRIELYKKCPNVIDVKFADRFKYGKHHYYLSHYPTITANFDDHNNWRKTTYCLCGHTHSREKFQKYYPCTYNVAMDAHNCTPVSIEEIEADIRQIYERGITEWQSFTC